MATNGKYIACILFHFHRLWLTINIKKVDCNKDFGLCYVSLFCYFPKDPELKKLYDYLAQYFEPKIRLPQAGSKSAESLEDCQEQDAGAAGVESGGKSRE